ncbi:transmembrane protein 26-like [Ciona intestinalis]
MKDIILALVTRALFAAHGLIAIWRAQTEWNQVTLWLLLIPIGALVLEALFTVGVRGGEEYKWISPCVLLYLCGVVPSIWFLELKNLDVRGGYHYCNDRFWGKLKEPGCILAFENAAYVNVTDIYKNATTVKAACAAEALYLEQKSAIEKNLSLYTTISPTTTTEDNMQSTVVGEDSDVGGKVVGTIEDAKKAIDQLLSGVNIFDRTTWVLVLHQLLLFILIIGRGLLPTGEGISRDELSQLLLVFIGVGADILEFVTETVKEVAVRCDRLLIIFIMAFWSWSTLQFTFVLTAAKARRTRAVGIYDGDSGMNSPVVVVEESENEKSAFRKFFTNIEVWGILSTLILQDGPFLAMRLYIMIGRNVVHQMIVFFTCKNCLVVLLQVYRLSIIAFAKPEEEEEEDAEAEYARGKIDQIKTLALAKGKFKAGLKNRASAAGAAGTSSGKKSPIPVSKVSPKVEVTLPI